MVVRIHNLSKWLALQPGEMLELKGQDKRRVTLEVNCPALTRFDVVIGDVPTFLAVVQGWETLQFSAPAECFLVATSDDEVWYFTNDGDQIAAQRPEAVTFTKIANRRTRNPDLERMMFKMEQNALRREAALRDEIDAMRAAQAEEEDEADEVGDGSVDGAQGAAAGGEGGVTEPPAEGQGTGAAA